MFMNEFVFQRKLTIDYILSVVSAEKIFEQYLSVSVQTNHLFRCPSVIRSDRNPTCSFYYKGGKLRFRDFHPGSLWGDCFDCVGYIIGANPNDKQGMYQILVHIVNTFPQEFNLQTKINNSIVKIETIFTEKPKPKIDVVFRKWNQYDFEYWSKIGNKITFSMLDMFEVFPCDVIYNYDYTGKRKIFYQYKISDPAYAYYEGTDANGIHNWRIYFPYRSKPRFYSNNTEIQGLRQFKPDKYGLITKSKKDIICLHSFGILSIAPAGEGIRIIKDVLEDTIFKSTVAKGTLFDYDYAGINAARFYRKHYNLKPYFLADSNPYKSRSTFFCNSKDISELNMKKGSIFTGNAIYSIIKRIENENQTTST